MGKNKKTRPKPLIVLWEDKEDVLQAFRNNHAEYYDIFATPDGNEFWNKLLELSKQHTSPDVIVIDLSHPISTGIPPEVLEQLDQRREDTDATIKKLNLLYNQYHEKTGFDMIERARRLFSDTPITAYTSQFGTLQLADEDLVHLSKQNCSLLLKKKPAFYEHQRIDEMMESAKKTKQNANITKYTSWVLAVIVFILPLICSWLLGKSIDFLVSFLASLPLVVLPFIASRIERIMSFFERLAQKNR